MSGKRRRARRTDRTEQPIVVDSPFEVAQVEARLATLLSEGLLFRWPGGRYGVSGFEIGDTEFHVSGERTATGFRAVLSNYHPSKPAINHRAGWGEHVKEFVVDDDDTLVEDRPFEVTVSPLDGGARVCAAHRRSRPQRSIWSTALQSALIVVAGGALLLLLHLGAEHLLLRPLPSWVLYGGLFLTACLAWPSPTLVTEEDRLAMYRVLQLVCDPAVPYLDRIPVDQTPPEWPQDR